MGRQGSQNGPASDGVSVPVRRGPSRVVLASLVSVVALLVMIAGTLVVIRSGPVADWLADEPSPTVGTMTLASEPSPPPVLVPAGFTPNSPAAPAAPSPAELSPAEPSAAGNPSAGPPAAPADAPTGADGPVPTAAGVRAAIGGLVSAAALGPRVHVSVVDVDTRKTLYSADPDAMTIPASTTKLITAAAVLAARGPAYRLRTRVVAGVTPGEVVIVGGGDPTLGVTANALFPGAARLDQLAGQVRKALGGVRPTRVVVDGSLFTGPTLGPGWDPDIVTGGQGARITALSLHAGRVRPVHHLIGGDPRFADPSQAAGRAFARALGVPASAVTNGRAPYPAGDGGAPDGTPSSPAAGAASPPASGAVSPPASGAVSPLAGAELGVVTSPPLVRIVDWMLQLSDNVLAEALARQVAIADGRPASFAGAAAALEASVTRFGLPATKSDLLDGSGLARGNRLSPSLLTGLLALAAGGTRPELTAIFGGLPVAGWSGTLQDRFTAARGNRAGQGLVRAKTGTLSGVSAISGELVTVQGRLLVFAIMADAVPGDSAAARTALDRIATKLVSCGCR